MRALVQRVRAASVSVEGETISQIGNGALIFLGVADEDGDEQIDFLVSKIANLRIFEDEEEKMNLSLKDVKGEAIVVSQFTLYADTRKGRRPSFVHAAKAEIAEPLVSQFIDKLNSEGIPSQSGQFGVHMLVEIENDGPVTIWLEKD
jgi:D-tyrosyl-tRNA(Tyr) deacylase